jgi:hypothetical protein
VKTDIVVTVIKVEGETRRTAGESQNIVERTTMQDMPTRLGLTTSEESSNLSKLPENNQFPRYCVKCAH